MNKTGTTSLASFFASEGFSCGSQAAGESLLPDYAAKRWEKIIALAQSAQFFQDIPFCGRDIIPVLHAHFPNALFILTKRHSAKVWADSLIRFHSAKFGNGHTPTYSDLKTATYRYPGYMWECMSVIYHARKEDPYHLASLIAHYENHNNDVKRYFDGSPHFLEVEIEEVGLSQKIATFVGFTAQHDRFPHLNKFSI